LYNQNGKNQVSNITWFFPEQKCYSLVAYAMQPIAEASRPEQEGKACYLPGV